MIRPIIGGFAGLALAGTANVATAKEVINLVHPFPDPVIYTKSCKQMVRKLNKAGQGKFEVRVKGGHETINMFQQPQAVRTGVVDMACTAAAFYAKNVPENEAVDTTNISSQEARENGGMALIDRINQRKFRVKFLGFIDAGSKFHIYLAKAPKWRKDGMPDFTGVKMRGNPVYAPFFAALGATTHQVNSAEAYSAFQRGIIDAAAWPSIGLMDLKWDEFLKYRLDPGFWTAGMSVIFNLQRWKRLDPSVRKLIQDGVIEHEKSSRAAFMASVEKDAVELKRRGMTMVTVPKPETYLKTAVEAAYGRMKRRLKARGDDVAVADTLKKLWQK